MGVTPARRPRSRVDGRWSEGRRRDARAADRPPGDLPDPETEEAIAEVAVEHPTDGYRMVWALVRRNLGRSANRKRVLGVMREQKLMQRRRPLSRRRRAALAYGTMVITWSGRTAAASPAIRDSQIISTGVVSTGKKH